MNNTCYSFKISRMHLLLPKEDAKQMPREIPPLFYTII
jgi:hypothetical protein